MSWKKGNGYRRRMQRKILITTVWAARTFFHKHEDQKLWTVQCQDALLLGLLILRSIVYQPSRSANQPTGPPKRILSSYLLGFCYFLQLLGVTAQLGNLIPAADMITNSRHVLSFRRWGVRYHGDVIQHNLYLPHKPQFIIPVRSID